ncbi:CTP-dependent diacylglycerol kinase 1 [Fusarium oxysporum f. sp. albedinis]|nr:CTP-dependent diacylglycerol kinase 1 [Fusarium oxysporum f. sp. albedinis]
METVLDPNRYLPGKFRGETGEKCLTGQWICVKDGAGQNMTISCASGQLTKEKKCQEKGKRNRLSVTRLVVEKRRRQVEARLGLGSWSSDLVADRKQVNGSQVRKDQTDSATNDLINADWLESWLDGPR